MKPKKLGRYLVADPKICHGKLTFRGTRVLVRVVLELVAEGMDWDEIVRGFHNSFPRAAIADAIRIAGRAAEEHHKTVKKAVPA